MILAIVHHKPTRTARESVHEMPGATVPSVTAALMDYLTAEGLPVADYVVACRPAELGEVVIR